MISMRTDESAVSRIYKRVQLDKPKVPDHGLKVKIQSSTSGSRTITTSFKFHGPQVFINPICSGIVPSSHSSHPPQEYQKVVKNKNKQTRFPVARIKKIMQKDDEVGKVAQATPIVISKALELFMADLVQEASNITIQRGAKRLEAYHLKHAIETIDTFDFLREIVAPVPDPTNGGQIPEDGGSDDGAAPRKRRARRTKAEMEADAERS
ncbi:DNA polymerase epsilon subunit C OS=Schizosaccharomyces pombe (strain 972 / ATCC 24843) GN=dpb3 PE=1 SV=1 [Rhizoctonia solani AG-1 IB]|uniref:DNA polymerase epsilon subunit C n=2 Tax=Rhizoctonia solani TaxID=456999 RepID=A0A0B7FGL0_THACB|nr:DNA polymerase epsilon subunit C OS=Schizosaccharomyces pombe (strain 972 / ATCC 24843) GN=dpb3 PE=1 SV=1 [Rhizoctonia solani AG-1 IB]